jgi:preprotein translocase subunit YajC
MEGLEGLTPIIFLVLFFVVIYFLMIRPRRKQQKAHEDLMQELRKGDKVITNSGIYGQIESVNKNDDTVILKVESGATMKVARGSILGKQGEKQIVGR